MTRILSFDTSSEACSVGLLSGHGLFSKQEMAPRMHAQRLLPMIQTILSENHASLAGLDVIAFGCGPGSFTGLRIAAGVAQGLSYGSDCGVLPVSNLQAMALKASDETDLERILVVLDARMDEVYWATFSVLKHSDSDKLCSVIADGPERVSVPEQVELDSDAPVYAIGNGLKFLARFDRKVRDRIESLNEDAIPLATDIARAAQLNIANGAKPQSAIFAKPTYVRDDVAWKKLPGRE